MASTKGTDVVSLRNELRDRGPAVEGAVVARLSPEQRQLYERGLASDWNDVELQMGVYLAAATTLFPTAGMPMRELGRVLGARTYRGVYRVFLRFPTVEFIVGRAASMWSTFYDTGHGEVEKLGPNRLAFVVRGFPGMPRPMREMAIGHIEVLLEATGAKSPDVRLQDSEPDALRYEISWK
jgi:uncharacterized protein (TIGR02265 family)